MAGHTDLLAHLTGLAARRDDVLCGGAAGGAGDGSCSARRGARALTRELVEVTIDLTARELPRFGYPAPRLAVAGLNPHAGEHGVIGREDDDVLAPAVAAARARGIDVDGPVSRRTRSSSARCAASSTPSSRAITTRG